VHTHDTTPPCSCYFLRWTSRLYRWVIHWAGTPYAVAALFVLAVAESSFFPIPPDVLLIAMAFSVPTRAFYYALVCSTGSVIGGIIGYAIGMFCWSLVGDFFLTHIISEELFAVVTGKYQLYSFWIVFTAALTPIPYKIFTITAGVSGINFVGFVVASIVGRSLRFFLIATLMYFFGEKAKKFIERYFEWITLAFVALLVLGFLAVKRFL